MKIKETFVSNRPYEKCLMEGVEALSDIELLAVIIRTGTRDLSCLDLAHEVFYYSNNKDGLLNLIDLSINDLTSIKGIGKVKAIELKCIGELSKRIARAKHGVKPVFSSAKAVAAFYMEQMRHLKRERLVAVFLDTACQFIGEYEVSLGTVNASIASPREIFIEALNQKAVNIILIHNHPSGNPTPSREDVILTKNLIKAGDIIGISVIDHIVIGDNTYKSFKEEGIMS